MSFRADGKRVKNADPMYTVAPFIMDKRYDAMNMIELDIPLEPIQKYINQKRKEAYSFFSNLLTPTTKFFLLNVAEIS